MSFERTPTEVAAVVATDAIVRDVAAQALLIPAETLSVTRLAGDASSRSFCRVARPEGTLVAVRYPWPFNVGDGSNVRFDRWCEEWPEDGRLTFANDPLCHLE